MALVHLSKTFYSAQSAKELCIGAVSSPVTIFSNLFYNGVRSLQKWLADDYKLYNHFEMKFKQALVHLSKTFYSAQSAKELMTFSSPVTICNHGHPVQ